MMTFFDSQDMDVDVDERLSVKEKGIKDEERDI
jgi:hypothetical protein